MPSEEPAAKENGSALLVEQAAADPEAEQLRRRQADYEKFLGGLEEPEVRCQSLESVPRHHGPLRCVSGIATVAGASACSSSMFHGCFRPSWLASKPAHGSAGRAVVDHSEEQHWQGEP